MKQYHNLLQEILDKGTHKDAARENLPGTTSLFGHQMKFNLSRGFPLLTTKEVSLKNIAVELIWFLKGESNIKYLVDNGVKIWNQDSFNFYIKKCNQQNISAPISFELFCNYIKNAKDVGELEQDSIRNSTVSNNALIPKDYKLGDTGVQYPRLWRKWEGKVTLERDNEVGLYMPNIEYIDQIANLIEGLELNPLSRRHILTAWDPANLDNLALNTCHAFVQFNCRPLTFEEKIDWAKRNIDPDLFENLYITELAASDKCPKYYLDCHMYQRSMDTVLGCPYNIASYSLLIHMLCKAINMIPGIFIHSVGDAHIYDDHLPQVREILAREPKRLPTLELSNDIDWKQAILSGEIDWKDITNSLENYNPDAKIKAELFTGLIK